MATIMTDQVTRKNVTPAGPEMTAWAIIIGVMEISAGIMLNRLYAAVAGILAVIFGFVIFARPVEGILAMVTVLGVFAIVRGIIRLVEAVIGVPTLEVGAQRRGKQLP